MNNPTIQNTPSKGEKLQQLAQDFLYRLKLGEKVDDQLKKLAELDANELAKELNHDDLRKAFWTNLYNGFNLWEMRLRPEVNTNHKSRMKHFLKRQFKVAGKNLSLMDIENGILRRSKTWWGLGYIPRGIVSSFEKNMRVNKLDARIHFALNCGAMSCPPIRFYTPENIDAELDLATRSYLLTEVKPGEGDEEGKLFISSLFRAYRGDFRGYGGIMPFIYRFKELPQRKWKTRFIAWDSSTELDDFVPS